MKGLAILLFCIVALAAAKPRSISSDAASACAKDDSEGVLVAHENCNRFYKCNGGKPVALDCPAGLMYNIKEEYCDWASNVECGERTTAEIPEGNGNGNENENENGGSWTPEHGHSDPSQAPAICAAKDSDGVLVAHENCNQFYKCFKGLPVALDCPSTLLYQPKLEICDWPQNVKCGDRVIPNPADKNDIENDNKIIVVQPMSIPSDAASACAKDDSEGALVAHENCNRFYKCNGGKPVALDCPAGLMYNIKEEYCDWASNVECGERTTAEIPEGNGNGNENENENGGSWTPEHGHSDPSQASAICAAKDSDGVLVAHENCNQFYKCFKGLPVALDCPSTLLYQPKLEICDWPQNVKCGDRVIPNPADKNDIENDNKIIVVQPMSIPSDAAFACAKDDSEGVLVAHENCNRFYKCNGGKPVALDCPAGLMYNIKEEYCDWASNVECGERTTAEIPEGNGNGNENENENGGSWNPEHGHNDPSQASAICAAKDSDGVLVAHENCSQFYKCLDQVPIALDCPASLLYHPELESCDWPQNVDCSGRSMITVVN